MGYPVDPSDRFRQMMACESEDIRDRVEGVPPIENSVIDLAAHQWINACAVLAKLIERAGDGFDGKVVAEFSITWNGDLSQYVSRADVKAPVLRSQKSEAVFAAGGMGNSPSSAQLELFDR